MARWLVFLIVVTVLAVLLPAVGVLFPSVEWLRGFLLTWSILLMAWMLVGIYRALEFIARLLE